MTTTLDDFIREILDDGLALAVMSGRKNREPEKIRIRPVLLQGRKMYQAEYVVNNKAFQRNLSAEELTEYLAAGMSDGFRQLQCSGKKIDGTVLVSKKGKITIRKKMHEERENTKITAHNRVRNYILQEGTPVPFLQDLGVMTQEGKIVSSRYDKFRQINRFLEFVQDTLPHLPKNREIHVLDFGCGKSYLTFAVYYYLHEKLGMDVRITGLDLKEDVIEKCSLLADRYGYTGLSFRVGNVEDYCSEDDVDLMITLHACDTATDYALYTAVQHHAGVILSVPCCQHELNGQIKGGLLEPVLKYGILKERMSALITDGIRAELLRECGYDVQLLEFIDMEHTPKNLLIRAVKNGNCKNTDREALERMVRSMSLSPTLYRLLDGRKPGEINEENTAQAASADAGLYCRDRGDSAVTE